MRLQSIIAATMIAGTAQAADTGLLPFEQYSLGNGLTVILHRDDSTPVAAVMMMYHVGSKNEKPGRTGFAHLFEHMMFKGSAHVADGEHFRLLQEAGANINGSTTEDRTNYFEVVPSNALELALYLESDRMGFLLDAVNQAKLDNQRDVVKNERRQNYDNRPYGTAYEKIAKAMYPADHPYSWPVIGSMADLSAASLKDVKEFFRTYYAPNNACLVIAGSFDEARTKVWIQKYFGPFSRGKSFERPKTIPVRLDADKKLVMEDKVQLPRLYLAWPSAPFGTRDDAVLSVLADILASGKSSRLYASLVYERQIAQSVACSQDGAEIGGQFMIQVTAKPGHSLLEMERAVNDQIAHLLKEGVTGREIESSVNRTESRLVLSTTTSLGAAGALATYFTLTGDADNFNKELDLYKGITPEEVQRHAAALFEAHKVVLSVVPEGKSGLSAGSRDPEVPR